MPAWTEMDYSDLQFHNIQLMKLVSSAEILFQYLYEFVSVENQAFISQWLCHKEEYDADSNSQFDINENVEECFASMRIVSDEVSENEKISSVSSVSTSSSDSTNSCENDQSDLNDAAACENVKSFGMFTHFPKTEDPISQVDADLLEYMAEFKLCADSYTSDWIKKLSFSTFEIEQFMSWLENKEYEKLWTDIYNNSLKNSELDHPKCGDPVVQVGQDNPEKPCIPIETSHLQKQPSTAYASLHRRNLTHHSSNVNLCHEDYVDQHVRYLQEVRHVLMFVREKLNTKCKKDELKSSIKLKNFLKVDVAFEIIDLSIEMKNQLKLGRDIENLTANDEIDTIIADCLRVLSLNEIRHLFITYLTNVVDMRKCSSKNDKLVRKLESEISDMKIVIWLIWNRYMTRRKEYEQKLHLMRRTTTDQSNDESMTDVHSRKLLSIVAGSESQNSSQSETKASQSAISCVPNIPERSLKQLQKTAGSSSDLKVTRIPRKKLIIRTQKR